MNIEEQDYTDDIQGDNTETIDFDNILEQRIKLGRTQVMVFISCAILWLADGAEMLVVGFILPVIQKEWDLSDLQINWLGSMVFFAWALGAIFVGRLADKIGRRIPLIAGAAGQFFTAVLSSFAPNYGSLIVLRSLFGFCLGLTAPISVTNFSETFPKKNRGRYFIAASSFFIIGELLTVFMAYLCLSSITSGDWRLLLIWSSIPGAVALVFILSNVKESPRYLLLCTDKYEKAFSIINKMIETNHKKSNLYEPLQIKEYEKVKILKWVENTKQASMNEKNKIQKGYTALFQKEYKQTTIKLMLMWFSLSVIYYGIMYILPTTLIKMHGSEKYEEKVTGEEDKVQDDFWGIAATTIVEIPVAILVMFMIENKKFGRKNSMTIAYGICSVFCFLIFFIQTPNTFFFILVSGAKMSIGFCFSVIYPFTAEIYSTNIRAAGCGLNNSICRVGGVLMPWLSFVFFYIANTGPFLVYCFVGLLSFVAAYKLEADTTNMELDKFVDKRNEAKMMKKNKQKGMEKLEDNNDNINSNKDSGIINNKNNNQQIQLQQINNNNIVQQQEQIDDSDIQVEIQQPQNQSQHVIGNDSDEEEV